MTQQRKACLALMTTAVLWGTSFVAIRESMHFFSPGGLALLRYLMAAVAVLPVYFWLPSRTLPTKKEWMLLILLGLCGMGIYNIFLNTGEVTTSSAIASFIISQGPVATIILAVIFLKERLTPASWWGMGLSVFGIVIIAYAEERALGHFNPGILYLMGAVLCAAIYSILQKSLLKRFHPLEITAWSTWFGALSLFIYLPNLYRELPLTHVLNFFWPIFLAIGSGLIGYGCLSYGFKHYPASKAISFLFAMPFVSVVVGWVLLGEAPTWLSLAGGVLAILGALMIRVLPTDIERTK